jgi:hypothetical protein
MSLKVVQVPPSTVERVEGVIIGIPALAYIGVDDDKIVGSCGLAWGNGRCWIWLQFIEPKPSYAITVYRKAKMLLKKAWQMGENEVFTPRDDKYPTSKKLLTTLGFQKFTVEAGVEIWRYVKVD